MERAPEELMHALAPGTRVGAWRVKAWQGQGAYGAVYRAERVGFRRLEPGALKSARLRAGALRELQGRVARRLRLSRAGDGRIAYRMKRPLPDGTTHLLFTGLELLRRVASLVPAPRANLTRFHGVFAPGEWIGQSC